MLPASQKTSTNANGPVIVLLHWLSGSSLAWPELCCSLRERGFRCIAVDLPGFGSAANVAGFDVAAMRHYVISTLTSSHHDCLREPWLLAGHSMGGKVAAVVARAAVDGRRELENLRGMVLFSPSPPGAEPMKDSKRKQMLESLGEATGDAEEDRNRAATYINENTGKLELPADVRERAVTDVLRMNRTAFRMWLEHGSREDWSERIGTLPLSALVFAGSEDEALGETAQGNLTVPHYQEAELITLAGAGHLIPMERAREATEHICEFAAQLGMMLTGDAVPLRQDFAALLDSHRTSPQTRAAMNERLEQSQSWDYTPRMLGQPEFRTLRALASRILPDAGFDTAAFLERSLADHEGDGWRFADLPSDAAAWEQGLRSLDAAAERKWGASFLGLDDARMDELLTEAGAGELGKGLLGTLHVGTAADSFGASQMKLWMEEVRAEFAKWYMAHPRTMSKIGFTGFADEGGFTQIRLGEREEFEL